MSTWWSKSYHKSKQIFHKGNDITCLCLCVPNLGHNSLFRGHYALIGGGGGKPLHISIDRDNRKNIKGLKENPKKSLDHDLTPQKIPSRDKWKLSRILTVLYTQESPCLNQPIPKNLRSFLSFEIWSIPHSRYVRIKHLSRQKKTRLNNETEN